ncbi:hypothetical protein ACFQ08_20130 [Streptosporangium algeriense]|uniref:Lasso RiPP family leader peptide-containing protein n=1 Tax=Streptosporangium algeriense TaxID=1682748 RepID=A0ABW3DUW5_9ACTN
MEKENIDGLEAADPLTGRGGTTGGRSALWDACQEGDAPGEEFGGKLGR